MSNSELQNEDRVSQVQVIPFRDSGSELEVLLLQRNALKGGFWQPVTGGVSLGESPEDAAYREVEEELGVGRSDIRRFINEGYQFTFTNNGRTLREDVFAILLDSSVEVRRSDEHVAEQWTNLFGAMALLKYVSNKRSVEHYWRIMESLKDD